MQQNKETSQKLEGICCKLEVFKADIEGQAWKAGGVFVVLSHLALMALSLAMSCLQEQMCPAEDGEALGGAGAGNAVDKLSVCAAAMSCWICSSTCRSCLAS